MPYIIIGILFFIAGIFFFIKAQKIKIQKQQESYNLQQRIQLQQKTAEEWRDLIERLRQRMKQEQKGAAQLRKEKEDLQEQIYKAKLQLIKSKEDIDIELSKKEQQLQAFYSKLKDNYSQGYDAYSLSMEKAYQNKENEINIRCNKLEQECSKLQAKKTQIESDLNQIEGFFRTAAAIKLKEQESLEQKQFYQIQILYKRIEDIKLLEKWKQQLYEPAIVSKIIWSSYVIKPTSQLCNRVLGSQQVCGIYKITNLIDGKIYIGQSVNVADRWKTHIKYGLGIDTPSTNKLYTAMQAIGVWNFTFELLEKCPRDKLNKRQQYWINLYQSNQTGYNSTIGNKEKI